MKKTLFSLVLMFLCVAMVFTSCDMFKKDEPVVETPAGDSPEVAADKAAIVNVLSGTKIGDVLADIEEVAIPDMNEITAEIEAFKAQADLTVSELGDIRGVIADGNALIYVGAEGEYMLGAAIGMTGEQLVATSQTENGYTISLSGAMPEFDQDQIDEVLAMAKQYADILDAIEVPNLTSSLITKDGDWYMINREFVKGILKSYIVGIATEQGAEINEETLKELDEELANITVDLGFAVSGDKIRGIKVNVEAKSESTNGGYDSEGNYSETKTEHIIKVGFDALLTNDLKALDRVGASYSMDDNIIAVVIDTDMTAEELKAVKVTLDYNDEDQDVDATLDVNFADMTKANANVLALDVDVHIKDASASAKLGTIDASIKNDANGVGQISFKIATDGETSTEVTGTLNYNDAPNAPVAGDFVFTLIDNAEAFDAKGQEILEAYYAYFVANTTAEGYPATYANVVFYDAELDVTLNVNVDIMGIYNDIYDEETGEFVGRTFAPELGMSEYRVRVLEGNTTPESYHFTATVVEGEYVFTANENTNTDVNGGNVNINAPEGDNSVEE